MVRVCAQTALSGSLEDTWATLGRREAYLCFPGISPAPPGPALRSLRGALSHDLDLPLIGPEHQIAILSVGRGGAGNGHRGRRFAMRGPLVSIAGRWQLAPAETGVRLGLTLEYEVSARLQERAVNELRSRSPLPIRTDADAILGRAVEEFFERRFAEDAAAYCQRLRARLEGPRPS
jgi:hypothetical protein